MYSSIQQMIHHKHSEIDCIYGCLECRSKESAFRKIHPQILYFIPGYILKKTLNHTAVLLVPDLFHSNVQL